MKNLLTSGVPSGNSADKKIFQTNRNNTGIEIEESVPGYQHCDGLWFEADKHDSYAPLAQHIYEHLIVGKRVSTVLELGSGAGSLAYHLRKLDPKLLIVTVDANKETWTSPFTEPDLHFIARTDDELEFFYENGRRVVFDLILSFEHFEHVQDSNFPILIENLKKHISTDSICFCSAASWGGPGKYSPHCNVKTLQEWESYLLHQGFALENTEVLGNIPTPFNFNWDHSSKLLFRLKR
jgi:SAM-dependent methyltransferase